MRTQEVRCFQTALECERHQLEIFDLTAGIAFGDQLLRRNDLVVIGGSGNYSVADGGPWWESAASNMVTLYDISKPSFASCWGFQAMARALGGEVVSDPSRAEVGTLQISLTSAGADDPIFGSGPTLLDAQFGHQDIVERLPRNAICLASSDRVVNQAMMFPGKPIYGTQFHPELNRQSLVERIQAYPQYVENIAGMPVAEFIVQCRETPDSMELLRRFVRLFCL